ncbi:MAG: hypothetical protein CEN88_374 [Candidatus Berkelbacteria bacterium Licking1014_2]|uniref:HNH nuclease domain-containing protein n=1 Tax=Candidatus Berkelbacteria bacterium Licking1014_2 TaxID=2017146 RepID=A0A554LTT5_9BACT|nr:MAG: hypothetical protein CEN88_374 [Candidatus Berkelbacteria bacterium Licking1014_2]
MPIVKCQSCHKDFYIKPCHQKYGWGKFCSNRCYNIHRKSKLKGKNIACFMCGKKFYRTPNDIKKSKSGKFFCNKSCQTIWRNSIVHIGENHPNWKGGEHQEYKIFLEKSNKPKICSNCRLRDKRVLIAHHIDKKRSNNTIENLVWLCLNCHHLVHRYNKNL